MPTINNLVSQAKGWLDGSVQWDDMDATLQTVIDELIAEEEEAAEPFSKAIKIGDFVQWQSSGGTARGKVTRIVQDGALQIPDSSFKINGDSDDPAVLIRLYRENESTGEFQAEDVLVGHKMSTLSAIGDLTKSDPTSSGVHVDGVNWKTPKKKKKSDAYAMDLIHKANEEQKFTLGPWYIPNKEDAHGEWSDADELQKALWDYVRLGDRDIRLQHNTDIVAGEWVEAMSFPVPVTLNMKKAQGDSKEVTYPAGTVFLGVKWNDWAWDMVKENKITGFSIGGSAARVEMGIPADADFGGMVKNRFSTASVAAEYAEQLKAQRTAAKKEAVPFDEQLKDAVRNLISGAPVEIVEPQPQPEPEVSKSIVIDGVKYAIVPLSKVYNDKVFNVAGLYGDDGSVAIVRTDGERFWASGSKRLESLPYEKAQYAFAEVAKAKRKFGGDRSAAGRYAAQVRWGRKRLPDGEAMDAMGGAGSLAAPTTLEGMILGSTKFGAASLVTHCDLDAVAADMQAAGLKEPTADMYYKHLSPERQAAWDGAIAEKLDGVPVNPDGPNAYMMGGGGASGKSSAIKDGVVSVPNADPSSGPVKAVDVNPDSAKTQISGYNKMVAEKDTRAANFHHEESSQIAMLTGAAGLRQGSDLVVDGVANNGAAKTMGKADGYRAMGAKRVELHVVTVDIDTARSRNVTRAAKTGRLVDDTALVGGHKGVSKNFETYASSGKWDTITVIDTNGPTKKIFEMTAGGERKILDPAAYKVFIDKQNYSGK